MLEERGGMQAAAQRSWVKSALGPATVTPARAAQKFPKQAKMEEPVLFGKLVIVGK